MTGRSNRLVLLLLVIVAGASIFYKGHAPSGPDGSVAFSACSSSGVTVRLAGSTGVAGVYCLAPDATVHDIISAADPALADQLLDGVSLARPLANGDLVEISESRQRPALRLSRMSAGERMLLGIALNPNRMGRDDWQALPGIGPQLAQRIVDDRMRNGNFRNLEDLLRVPGIGTQRIEQFSKYFVSDAALAKVR